METIWVRRERWGDLETGNRATAVRFTGQRGGSVARTQKRNELSFVGLGQAEGSFDFQAQRAVLVVGIQLFLTNGKKKKKKTMKEERKKERKKRCEKSRKNTAEHAVLHKSDDERKKKERTG
mgnify:CR=1 FL=1